MVGEKTHYNHIGSVFTTKLEVIPVNSRIAINQITAITQPHAEDLDLLPVMLRNAHTNKLNIGIKTINKELITNIIAL